MYIRQSMVAVRTYVLIYVRGGVLRGRACRPRGMAIAFWSVTYLSVRRLVKWGGAWGRVARGGALLLSGVVLAVVVVVALVALLAWVVVLFLWALLALLGVLAVRSMVSRVSRKVSLVSVCLWASVAAGVLVLVVLIMVLFVAGAVLLCVSAVLAAGYWG